MVGNSVVVLWKKAVGHNGGTYHSTDSLVSPSEPVVLSFLQLLLSILSPIWPAGCMYYRRSGFLLRS